MEPGYLEDDPVPDLGEIRARIPELEAQLEEAKKRDHPEKETTVNQIKEELAAAAV